MIDTYTQIDAFSEGRLKYRPTKFTARNMGNNRLWIAATAHTTNTRSITVDRDVEHLDGVFFEVILIEQLPPDTRKNR